MLACVHVYYGLGPHVHTHRTPFQNRTCLNHSNTRLVRYSDGYSIWIPIVVKNNLNPSQETGSRPICCVKLLTVSCPCRLRNCPIHWDATWKKNSIGKIKIPNIWLTEIFGYPTFKSSVTKWLHHKDIHANPWIPVHTGNERKCSCLKNLA